MPALVRTPAELQAAWSPSVHPGPLPSQPGRGPCVWRRPARGPAGAVAGRRGQPYLVVQSCRARGRQGLAHALLQGQPVPGIGGGGGRLPGARHVLGGARPILASRQELLPWVNLKEGEAQSGQRGWGRPAPREGAAPTPSGTAGSHGRPSSLQLWMRLGTREARTLTSLE